MVSMDLRRQSFPKCRSLILSGGEDENDVQLIEPLVRLSSLVSACAFAFLSDRVFVEQIELGGG